jgi:anti-sigma regulatory factor (Ser/Thr protein kinase)
LTACGLAQPRALPPSPSAARRELQSILEGARWPGDVEGVVLAVHEALMNSHHHAGGATAASVGLDGSSVVVEVRDSGPGFDVGRHTADPPDPMAERGRGLWLISQLAESWEVLRADDETCLRLRFGPDRRPR